MSRIFFTIVCLCFITNHGVTAFPSPSTEQTKKDIDYQRLDELLDYFLKEKEPADRNKILNSINQIQPNDRVAVLEKVRENADGKNGQDIARLIDQEGKKHLTAASH